MEPEAPATAPAKVTGTPSGRCLLICTVKDEGPNILEWVAYHRMIGFTDIVVFQNNSFDLTDRALRVLAAIGAIAYYPDDFARDHPRPPFQNRAYRRAARLPVYREAAWAMTLDADEFLQVNVPGGRLPEMIAALPADADEIRLNWRIFGSSGLKRLDDRLVTERFTAAQPRAEVARHVQGIKTLYRPARFARPGIHLPKSPAGPGIASYTGSGIPFSDVISQGFRCIDPGEYRLAQVNHYIVRDAESFLIKSVRGSSSHPDRAIRERYWRKRDRSGETDTTLADRAEDIRAAMAELDEASGGRLMKLWARSLRFWRKRIAELKQQPAYRDLYDALA